MRSFITTAVVLMLSHFAAAQSLVIGFKDGTTKVLDASEIATFVVTDNPVTDPSKVITAQLEQIQKTILQYNFDYIRRALSMYAAENGNKYPNQLEELISAKNDYYVQSLNTYKLPRITKTESREEIVAVMEDYFLLRGGAEGLRPDPPQSERDNIVIISDPKLVNGSYVRAITMDGRNLEFDDFRTIPGIHKLLPKTGN